jgi:protein-S-isoprenylcysteine O-methyltransferase Ste14
MAATTTPTLVIGPLRLTGRAAKLTVQALLAGITALVIYNRARIVSTPLTISALLWIAFQVYWGVAAKSAAASVRRESAKSRAVHQNLLMAGLLLLFVPVPWLDRRVLPDGVSWVFAGLALHAASLGLAIAARRTLGRNWSGEITQKVEHQLVRTGPYRFVRHPIYTAILGMSVGTALVSGDLHAFIGVALVGAAYARKIRLEERNLDEVFGSAYDEYRRSTWAILPPIY